MITTLAVLFLVTGSAFQERLIFISEVPVIVYGSKTRRRKSPSVCQTEIQKLGDKPTKDSACTENFMFNKATNDASCILINPV